MILPNTTVGHSNADSPRESNQDVGIPKYSNQVPAIIQAIGANEFLQRLVSLPSTYVQQHRHTHQFRASPN